MASPEEKDTQALREEIARLKQANAALTKRKRKDLGPGYWGLVPAKDDRNLTHEETLFLFARVWQMLGFQSIEVIQTTYPDCTVIEDGEQKYIEFEPYLSPSAEQHILGHDLSKCDYLVCWEDTLPPHSRLKQEIAARGVTVIELSEFWDPAPETKVGTRKTLTRKAFEELARTQQRILWTFVRVEDPSRILTAEEIHRLGGLEGTGKGKGGPLAGLRQKAILRTTGKIRGKTGWQLNTPRVVDMDKLTKWIYDYIELGLLPPLK